MIFARLDVCMWRHIRFVKAGPAACGLWAAALAYLRENDSEDGYMDPVALGQLLGLGESAARKLADRLVECGLFETKDDGYVLLRYAAKNETGSQIKARRVETLARVKRFRNGHSNADGNATRNALQVGLQNASVPGSGSGSVSDQGELEREPLAEDRYRQAYEAGVQRATGHPYSMPPKTQGALNRCILKHSGGARGPALLEWITGKSESFARAVSSEAKFYGHLSPEGFERWLNAEGSRISVQANANQYDSPAVREERKRREASWREAERTAAPAPMSDLLQAVGGKKT